MLCTTKVGEERRRPIRKHAPGASIPRRLQSAARLEAHALDRAPPRCPRGEHAPCKLGRRGRRVACSGVAPRHAAHPALARQLHTALMEAQKQSQYASMRLMAANRIEETIVDALRQEEKRRWR